ncbi:Glycogen synthase [Rubripirellula tenax]|uniref:Glycogen synthase n=1 Tax=Rubripirellula tenax TaxID=2528015 RepID=A0A5C6FGK1_9BACT|nr:glycosyltransferase family 4 protein [Rubripirellula tenax]TWU60611.1 Glycogen synthase [Rubripirellula tenax]
MRILVAHNSHKIPGGEQRVFESEVELLREAGHEVFLLNPHNDELDGRKQLSIAAETVWNRRIVRQINQLIPKIRPDVAHFHNVFPVLSPAVFSAVKRAKVSTVWTLHNYRLICPGMLLMRDGKPCEECVGKRFAFPAIRHRCYRNSLPATTVIAATLSVHRGIRTWRDDVDRFLVPSEFARRKLTAGGVPEAKLTVKPNFVSGEPGVGGGAGGYFLFVGRLSEEKGVHCLLNAWLRLKNPLPLKILGSGELPSDLRDAIARLDNVEFLGSRSAEEVMQMMADARATIVPSICYETFGLVVTESFSVGTPVIASDIGAIGELIDHGKNGLKFAPGDPQALASAVETFVSMEQQPLRSEARLCYERDFRAATNLKLLENVYHEVMQANGQIVSDQVGLPKGLRVDLAQRTSTTGETPARSTRPAKPVAQSRD